MSYKSDFINILLERGFLKQCTAIQDLDLFLFSSQNIPSYIGFDCTAQSLHVGSLIQIMLLRWWQKCGYKPLILLGGGTTKVGDPSGKNKARQILAEVQIKKNMDSIYSVFNNFIDLQNAIIVNNSDWLDNINYISFLRDYGSLFSVNKMLTFDSVKTRIEEHSELSFLEFNYMILQAYDFVELYRRYDCRLQMGGSDQWGNIVNGVDLGRRLGCGQLFGITSPLVTKSDGSKMGKTASGAIWLNSDMLSCYDYWQYFRNVDDADVGKFLRLFTELSIKEISKLEKLQGKDINEAKIILANEATKICHGEKEAKNAANIAQKAFYNNVDLKNNLPVVFVDINKEIFLKDLLVNAGVVASGGEAKRLIAGKGLYINNKQVKQDELIVASLFPFKLGIGKKKHFIVEMRK